MPLITKTLSRFVLFSVVVFIGACASQPQEGPAQPRIEQGDDDAQEAPAPAQGEEGPAQPKEGGMSYIGQWSGSLKTQGVEIGITVKFLADPVAPSEQTIATMDIPQQLALDLPLTEVSASGATPGSKVHFELETGGPKFIADGVLEAAGTISGTFTQGPGSGTFMLSFKGSADGAGEPEISESADHSTGDGSAVNSSEETVTVPDLTLHGTLSAPDTPGPWPVVILIAGSGSTDRDGNSAALPGPNNSLKMLGEQLAADGIATLRYDKRGLGESTLRGMSAEEITFGQFVNDALAWVDWAAHDQRFSKVYLAGHSEGGLIVLTALGSDLGMPDRPGISGTPIDVRLSREARETVSGAILLSTPSKQLDLLALDQLKAQVGDSNPLYVRAAEIVEALRRGETVEDIPQELTALFHPVVQPFLRSLVPFDPIEMIRAMPQKVLIIGGTEDLQVLPGEIDALSAARPDAEVVMITGMNHVLKDVDVGNLPANQRSYMDPAFQLAVPLVESIAGFVTGR